MHTYNSDLIVLIMLMNIFVMLDIQMDAPHHSQWGSFFVCWMSNIITHNYFTYLISIVSVRRPSLILLDGTCCHGPAVFAKAPFNSLWPNDTLWRHRPGSTLAQEITCCLTGSSHYLNQCWLIVSEVLWHSPWCSFTGIAPNTYPWYDFENY